MNRILHHFSWANSLLLQLTLISVGAIVLVWVISTVTAYIEIRNSLTASLKERASEITDQQSFAITDLLKKGEWVTLQKMVERIGIIESVQRVAVIDPEGIILAQHFAPLSAISETPTEIGDEKVDEPDPIIAQTDLYRIIQEQEAGDFEKDDTYTLATPLLDDDSSDDNPTVVGLLVIQMSLKNLGIMQQDELLTRTIGNLSLLVLVTGIITYSAYMWVIRPLRRITKGTQKMATGDLNTRINVRGSDEINLLVNSLNTMAADLKENQLITQKHLNETQTLYEISSASGQTLIPDEKMAFFAQKIAQLIDATSAYINLWDEVNEQRITLATYGEGTEIYRSLPNRPGSPNLTTTVITSGQPLTVYDTHNTQYISPEIANKCPDRSLLVLPLIINNRPIGSVLIGESRDNRVFTDYEIQLVMSAAGQIAATIFTAQIFAALASERNRLDEILNAVSDAILVTDVNWIVQYANRSLASVTGLSKESLLEHSIWNIYSISTGQPQSFFDEIKKDLSAGKTWRQETVIHRPDGVPFDADILISDLRDQEDNLIGYVASIRDITSLKELDRMKDRFVSTVSHELRTPLSVINLYTENLIEYYGQLSDEQRCKLLDDIHIETNTLHQLIEDLLCLSRLDSGGVETKIDYLDLSEVVLETVTSARALAQEKGITFEYKHPNNHVIVSGDRDQLAQVFRNVLSNAVKFTPSGGQVRVELSAHDSGITARVIDTGIGIAESDIPHLFERFYRSEQSIQREIPGTGLGLAITREILQRHNGNIEVKSETGKGSTFTITLPHPLIAS